MHYLPQQVTRAFGRGLVAVVMVLAVSACQTTKDSAGPRTLVWPDPPDDPRFYFEQAIFSSTDVVEETSAQRLKRMATGIGQGGKPLEKPWGVAAFDHRVYISDTVSRKIHYYDLAAKTYSDFGGQGVGSLAKPLGLSVDKTGRVFVCDGTGRRIVVYDKDGNYLTAMGNKEDLERPSSVAVNSDGSRVYVVDTGGVESRNHHVVVYDGNSGEKLQVIGTRGSGDGEFNLPVSLAVAPNGDFYVVDGGNFRIQGFTPDGKFKVKFGDVGRRSGQFARPKDIAIDREGNIYVTDSSFANFQIFNPKGELLLFVGERGSEGMAAQFMLPSGITVDRSDGRIYVVDQFFRKMEIYRPASTAADRPPRANPVAKKDSR